MVNPCAVKGIDIFVALAARMPHLRFAAVPTWGTNASDLDLLNAQPNITRLDPVDNIEDLLRKTRVMVVPSVWAEARSRIVVEAMLHGVPVVASDAGGIREAKLGVPYLIPVNPIRHYKPALDENLVPVAEIAAPEHRALAGRRGTSHHGSRALAGIAQQSRTAALRYVDQLSVEPFEQPPRSVLQKPKKFALSRRFVGFPPSARSAAAEASQWSQRRTPSWFPTLQTRGRGDHRLRLFCFPHAGGGTRIYRGGPSTVSRSVRYSCRAARAARQRLRSTTCRT